MADIDEIHINDLYINTENNTSKSLKTFLSTLQSKYEKNPDNYIKNISAAGHKRKRNNNNNSGERGEKHELSDTSIIPPTHCVSCNKETKNKNNGFLIKNKNNYRLHSICDVCNKQKSSFIGASKVPEKLYNKINEKKQK
ncbi:ORF MSV082 hypothetical protein [Melanoplus sanguinipes entomopoxvirus]|uniref:Uncharacterized protein n=1 Tax=Melanoplus sanguinipes entomopoxvirus TaxID=83191 RepID=Q9YW10_MSEPV|nr:ORF MSV082 hypothetical protein [Melanoplus sanguinipes entomopoxvirus]AAC97635.1 ORF MSV082 hypothetical protein [Melanoplus sanguinipes entomopoxvirus 'O']